MKANETPVTVHTHDIIVRKQSSKVFWAKKHIKGLVMT